MNVRNAPRVLVTIPALVEKIAQQVVSPDLALLPAYERVPADLTGVGMKVPGIIRDLSVNGVFIAGYPLPLLSRVEFTFPLPGWGQADAIGWVLWRRAEDAIVTVDGIDREFSAGFGVLFESISLDARIAIAQMVASAPPAP